MRSGRLRQVIKVFKRTQLKDDSGEFSNKWELVASPYCELVTLGGEEVLHGNVQIAVSTVEFKTRYSQMIATYTPDMYILFQDKKYDIQSVTNVNFMNRELRIVAKERR